MSKNLKTSLVLAGFYMSARADGYFSATGDHSASWIAYTFAFVFACVLGYKTDWCDQ